MFKKFFSHSVIYGLAPQITMVVNFLTLPIITKDLTDIDFGVSGILTAYVSVISILAILGLRVVFVNSFYKSPEQYKWGWRQLYGFLNIWNIIYSLLLGILVYVAIPKAAIENRMIIVFLNVFPQLFLGQTIIIGQTYYQLKQKPIQIAWRSLICGLLAALLNMLFISHYKMGYMGWFWSIFVVTIVRNATYWYPVNILLKLRPIYNFKWRYIKNSLKVGLPAIPHYYSGYLLNSANQLIMDRLKVGTSNIGKYNASNTFGTVMDGFGTATGWALGPLMNEKFKKKDDTSARNMIFMLQIIFLGVTSVMCIWMKELFHLMIKNSTLSLMYPLAIILIMAQNYRPMYLGANAKLFYEDKTNVLWKITLVAGIINVILNIVFISIYGFEISVYCTFLAFMYMGYAGFFYPIYKKLTNVNYYPFRWLGLTLFLTVIVYFLVESSNFVKVPVSIFISLLCVYSVFMLNKKIEP